MTPSEFYASLMKDHPPHPKVRSWVAIDSFLNRKAGAHDGSKKAKNKRERQKAKRINREDT